MRVMVMIKSSGANEDQGPPSTEILEAMNAYNEELVRAGVMLDGQGLHPSSNGAKVIFEAGRTSVVDGPFTEAKEVIAGYWLWQVSSLDEAIEWAKRCPSDPNDPSSALLELRQIFEPEDFGEALTPELREREQALEEQLKSRQTQA